jgi:hypothetical protein
MNEKVYEWFVFERTRESEIDTLLLIHLTKIVILNVKQTHIHSHSIHPWTSRNFLVKMRLTAKSRMRISVIFRIMISVKSKITSLMAFRNKTLTTMRNSLVIMKMKLPKRKEDQNQNINKITRLKTDRINETMTKKLTTRREV